MGVRAREVVVNEGLKRNSFRGVIEVVDGGESENRPKDQGKEKESNGAGSAKNGKRKQVEETASDGTPTISKRAAKRAKAQALKEKNGATSGKDISTLLTPLAVESRATQIEAESETLSKIKTKANG